MGCWYSGREGKRYRKLDSSLVGAHQYIQEDRRLTDSLDDTVVTHLALEADCILRWRGFGEEGRDYKGESQDNL